MFRIICKKAMLLFVNFLFKTICCIYFQLLFMIVAMLKLRRVVINVMTHKRDFVRSMWNGLDVSDILRIYQKPMYSKVM